MRSVSVRWFVAACALGLSALPADAQVRALTLRGAEQYGGFGYDIHAVGDINVDGFVDFVIGEHDTANGGHLGIYSGLNGSLLRDQRDHGTPGQMGYYGISTAPVADLDSDGIPELAIGASDYTPPTASGATGVVQIVSGFSGQRLHNVIGSDPVRGSFGISVRNFSAASSPVSDQILVGASGEANGSGRVHLVSARTGATVLTISNPSPGTIFFGREVTAIADVDQDAVPDIVVGGAVDPIALVEYVHVFSGATGSLLRTIAPTTPGRGFGRSIVELGDVNGDGFSDILVTSPRADTLNGASSGAAYVVALPSGTILQELPGSAPGDELGITAEAISDLTNDGVPELALGAIGFVGIYNRVTRQLIKRIPMPGLTAASGPHSLARLPDTTFDAIDEVIVGSVDELSGGAPLGAVRLMLSGDTVSLGAGLSGCSGSLAFPPSMQMTPVRMNSTSNVTISGGPANSIGMLFLGIPPESPIELSASCRLNVQPLRYFHALTVFQTDARGGATMSIPVPNDPGLSGMELAFQAYFIPQHAQDPLTLSSAYYVHPTR